MPETHQQVCQAESDCHKDEARYTQAPDFEDRVFKLEAELTQIITGL